MKLTREFKIGIVVTVALALLYWGINFLKGMDIFSNERVFYAIYDDVGGLEKANPVKINGLNVGQVRNMYFTRDGQSNIIIEIVLKNRLPVPKNSVAKIVSSDILGSKAVSIVLGNSTEYIESGDTIMADIEISIKDEVSRQLQPLKTKAENLMMSIDSVLTMLNSLFSSNNTRNIAKSVEHMANSFENLESTTNTIDTLLKGQRNRLERIFENIESITLNLQSNEENLNNIFANLSSFSDTLAQTRVAETINNINRAMIQVSDITSKINNGEGSLGMLVNDDSLYIELEKSSRELNLLLEDIRLNPKKYVKFSVF
ncbi:MAG: MlaD family protein [Bacteroidales bacterium]|nr:MlaD family protein [Bacteroidales bacterium]